MVPVDQRFPVHVRDEAKEFVLSVVEGGEACQEDGAASAVPVWRDRTALPSCRT